MPSNPSDVSPFSGNAILNGPIVTTDADRRAASLTVVDRVPDRAAAREVLQMLGLMAS